MENPSNPPSSPLPPPAATPSSLLDDLLEAARRRNLSGHSLLAYQRAWTRFLSWASATDCDPRQLSGATALQAYAWLSEGKGPASIKQLRAALSFAFQHWDLKNPFAQIEPPIHNEPQIHYLMLADVRRLLAHLRSQENNGYGARLAFYLANAPLPDRLQLRSSSIGVNSAFTSVSIAGQVQAPERASACALYLIPVFRGLKSGRLASIYHQIASLHNIRGSCSSADPA